MLPSIGTLAHSVSNRLQNVRIRDDLQTLAQEMTSGRKSDLRSALSGDLAPVAALERGLSNLLAFGTVTAEANLFTRTLQSSLGQLSSQVVALTEAALAMQNTNNPALVSNFGADATNRFRDMVATLNTTIAGRSLFAGAATDTRPVDKADLILDDLVAAIPPGATAADVSTAVDAYFGPGGGFETTRYRGSTTPLAPFRLSREDTIAPALDARQSDLRAAMAATAKAALIDRNVLGGDPVGQRALITTARNDLLQAEAGLVSLRGYVGTAEARIEAAQSRNSAEDAALQSALGELVRADPFQTATRLQATQTQLDTFYTVTARLSQLSLAGYLR